MKFNVDNFRNALSKTATKIQENIYMKSLTNTMLGLMPLMIIGSAAMLLGILNIGAFGEFMNRFGFWTLLRHINTMTFSVISLYVSFLTAYKLGEALQKDALNSGIVGIMSFLILTQIGEGGIELAHLGSAGMFVAMFGGIVGARLYILFIDKNLVIKMPDSVPPFVSKAFGAIVPGMLVALIMAFIFTVVSFTPFGNLIELTAWLIQRPLLLLGANIVAVMIIVAVIELLWFFGIHGSLTMMPVLMLIYQAPQIANMEAFAAGYVPPYLFTTGFILANRGARHLAVCTGLLRTKSKQLKTVGKLGFVPSVFGISEPLRFGIPQVMNFRMFIPVVISPALAIFSAWLLTIVGFLPHHNGAAIPFGFPVIANGFLIHGWQGIIAQIIQYVICVVVYIPFIRRQDQYYLAEERKKEEVLIETA